MKANEIDKKFDNNEDVLENFELSSTTRPNYTSKRVNVYFPLWMVQSLDHESRRLGITRQSLLKMWVADRIATEERV